MKALFLVFYGFQEFNGISKKIRYQIDALEKCGMDIHTCYYEVMPDGCRQWLVNGKVLANLGYGTIAKLKKRISFNSILEYIRENQITIVYMRSYHNANPFTIHFVKTLKKQGVKILLEIPTYPYDQEYFSAKEKVALYIDKLFRHTFCKHIDAIITYSDDINIFGRPTIRLSNGINFDNIPLRSNTNYLNHELHLIGVAEIHFWHGFDRIIKGLGQYYSNAPKDKVYFHLVGNLAGKREQTEIYNTIRDYGMKPYVVLHGAKHGQELNDLFNRADFAIGSLGRHRSGIGSIKTLKNREYAARGFSFIYSETDADFDSMSYILKVPADESPINIPQLIDFCHSQSMSPAEIRNSIQHLSWEKQMKKVYEYIRLST